MSTQIVKKGLKLVLISAAVFGLLSGTRVGASGDKPDFGSYMYAYDKEVKYGIAPYTEQLSFTERELGVEIGSISDLAVSPQNEIFILDAAKAQLLHLSQDCELLGVISGFDSADKQEAFLDPQGVFVGNDGRILVADTGNARVVILNPDYTLSQIINEPDAQLSQLDYEYEPQKAVSDDTGRIIVLAKNQTQGCLQFNAKGDFVGYTGANKIKADFVELFWRAISTKEQRETMQLFIPTEFNSIEMDCSGFLYATVGNVSAQDIQSDIDTNGSQAAPIRKINLQDNDILKRQGYFPPLGDLTFASGNTALSGPSSFVDITVDDMGNYSALDNKRGRVFTYNQAGELLYIFGNLGDAQDEFNQPCAIAYQGQNLLIADKDRNMVHLYSPTPFASAIYQAQTAAEEADSKRALACWQEVLSYDNSCDIAYTAMGKLYYEQKDYSQAMAYFERGNSKEGYSKAFQAYRKQVGEKALPVVFIAAALLAVVIAFIKFYRRKKPSVHTENIVKRNLGFRGRVLYCQLAYAKRVAFHPFDGFWDLKHEKRGGVAAATILLLLATVSNVLLLIFRGYLFQPLEPAKILLSGVLSILALVFLWTIAGWSLTTLMDGKGKAKEIYTYTCYCLTPLLVSNLILLLLSHFLSLEESAIYAFVSAAALIYTGFLLFCGTLSTHDFGPIKTVFAILLTIVAMGIILFIGILALSLVGQGISFVQDLVAELSLR